MERFRRKRSHSRVPSPLNATTIVDRSSGDRLISCDKAQKGFEQIGKERNFHKKLGSDFGSCSSGMTIPEDLITCPLQRKLQLGQSSAGLPAGTAMKKLLAEEMSRDVEATRRSPSVIARLMGLDGLPPQQKRSSENYQQKRASIGLHKNSRSYDNQSHRKSPIEPQMFKDVYEVMESSKVESSSYPSFNSSCRKQNEDEVAFVRGRFMDAKCLSTDEKLQNSKEFIDALEVLDSNKDLLLKFLDEPDSLFAKHLHDLHGCHGFHRGHDLSMKSSALKHNINAIGCREASRKIDISFSHKHQDGLHYRSSRGQGSDSYISTHTAAEMNEDTSAIPTRIVVLKPNLVKMQNTAKCISSSSSCDPFSDFEVHKENPGVRQPEAELPHNRRFPENMDTFGIKSQESRELAKEITRRMKKKLGVGSINIYFPKFRGYFADESSHDCSENDSSYGSDATTVISQTPFHCSSRGKSSSSHCSESSVIREAKKRLSERWKMTHRSPEAVVVDKGSTLGEMLAIPDVDVKPSDSETTIGQDGSFGRFNRKDAMAGWVPPLGISSRDGWKDRSFGSLSRSRSLPSSNYLGSPKTSVRQEVLSAERFLAPKECSSHGRNKEIKRDLRRKEGSFSADVRSSDMKFESFHHTDKASIDMVKVQFGKNEKKSSLDEKNSPDVKDIILETPTRNLDAKFTLDATVDVEHEKVPESLTYCDEQIPGQESCDDTPLKHELSSSALLKSVPKALSNRCDEDGPACSKLSATQQESPANAKEADQPSPVSVLEAAFTEEVSSGSECFERVSAELHGLRMQLQLLKLESEAYDGPMLISSDDDLGEVSSAFLKEKGLLGAEDSWESFYLVDVLAELEFDGANPDEFKETWHSPECPIALWVFEKLEKKYSDDATCSRSERRLLFDYINSGIMEIFQQFIDPHPWVMHPMKTTRPWWHKDGFKGELQKFLKTYETNASETTVNPSLEGSAQWFDWVDHIDAIGRGIEKLVIDELIAELANV